MVQEILDSESENPDKAKKKRKHKFSKLSSLSKLNLLGLIDLALIACDLKLTKSLDGAMAKCKKAIQELTELKAAQMEDIGIASQNLIEELLEHLMIIKELDERVDDHSRSSLASPIKDPKTKKLLSKVKQGNGIINSKEFKLVFFITCFVPFIKPNVAVLRPKQIAQLRHEQKLSLRKQLRDNRTGLPETQVKVDSSSLEQYRQMKETLLNSSDETTSMFLKLQEEEHAKKMRYDLAFQNTFMLDKYQPSKDRVVGFPYRQGTMGPLKSGSKTSKTIFSSGS